MASTRQFTLCVAPATRAKLCDSPFSSRQLGFRSDKGSEPSSSCCGGAGLQEANQDCAVVAYPMPDAEVLLGVFDGHGEHGDLVASFVGEHLAELLHNSCTGKPEECQLSSSDLVSATLECGEMLRRSSVPSDVSGTTAIVALLGLRRLRVACVGDSRSVLGVQGGAREAWSAIDLSVDQKASVPSEGARITACGGLVWGREGRAE